MNWLFLKSLKYQIVRIFQIWFYDVKRLPIGTHLFYFIKYRVEFELDTVFDVGANVGGFTNSILNIYPNSEVHCFEPIKYTFETLKGNLNTKRKLFLNQIALGDIEEDLSIRIYEQNLANINSLVLENQPKNFHKIEIIKVNTLDNYIKTMGIEQIDFLKIDTEGYDLKVLKGATYNLQLGTFKLIYVECGLDIQNKGQIHLSEFFKFLTDFGYRFVGLFQTDIRKINEGVHFSNALFVHNSVSSSILTFN